MFRVLFIFISCLFSLENNLQTGIDYFNARAENAKGLQANTINIDKAIQIFEGELTKGQISLPLILKGSLYIQKMLIKRMSIKRRLIKDML